MEIYKEIERLCHNGIPFPNPIDDDLKELIKGCLEFKDDSRWNWDEIFKSPYLK